MTTRIAESMFCASLAIALAGCECSRETEMPDATTDGSGRPDAAAGSDAGHPHEVDGGSAGDSGPPPRPQVAELWYAVDNLLIRIELDPSDGTVTEVTASQVITELPVGQNAITMLEDGSLLGARLSQDDDRTYFYYVPTPPDDGTDVTPISLGVMPDDLMLEALYSDCDGRLYAMDTGEDDTNAVGNRLLRFTGDVLAGDFTYVVVSDLSAADVADIDDMSPGIMDNEITDNPGFAIDSGRVHAFDYESGTGSEVAQGGTYGIHALGGSLFSDNRSRLYVLSATAELFEMDPVNFTLSEVLVTGPVPGEGLPGWSGLAGPLTHCDTGFLF